MLLCPQRGERNLMPIVGDARVEVRRGIARETSQLGGASGVDRQFPNISGPLDVGEGYAFARGRRLSFAAWPGGDPPVRTIDPPVVRAEPNRPEIVAVPERCREQNLIVLLRRPAARTPFQGEKRQSTLLEYLRGARVDRRCAIQWRDPPIEI